MTRIDRFALLLCFISLIANAQVSARVFENLPHLEDEMTYLWQAKVIAGGSLLIPSPPSPASFVVPFVIDHQGWRFGKYPLGFPVLLSFGLRLGLQDWINPWIAAWSLWLIYLLGKKLFGERTGLLAAFLTAASPFFLINSANYLSHAWSLFLSCALALAWLDLFFCHTRIPAWLITAVAGGCIGVLVLTRPWTAVGVALPFTLHGLILSWKGPPHARKRVLAVGLLAGGIGGIHFIWQAALTGSPWVDPYTLWWPFDRVGFGPGIGLEPGGYNLLSAFNNMLYSLKIGADDFLGWPYLSWLFLPFGIAAVRKNPPARLVSFVFPSLVFIYLFYWVGAWIFGPRYYYEGLYSITLLSAAGISWIYQRLPVQGKKPPFFHIQKIIHKKVRLPSRAYLGFTTFLGILIAANLWLYIPIRLGSLTRLYGVERSQLVPFQGPIAAARTPALVIVHTDDDWRQYATLLELSDPTLDSPYIFAMSMGAANDNLLKSEFPGRRIYHYYPQHAGVFYLEPLP
jgi:hypothetical protein